MFNTFKKAFQREDVTLENLTIQADRGLQYTSYGYKALIGEIRHSMNRLGHYLDNSPIESLWGILKSECLYNKNNKEKFKTRIAASNTIEEYIRFYNHLELH